MQGGGPHKFLGKSPLLGARATFKVVWFKAPRHQIGAETEHSNLPLMPTQSTLDQTSTIHML